MSDLPKENISPSAADSEEHKITGLTGEIFLEYVDGKPVWRGEMMVLATPKSLPR